MSSAGFYNNSRRKAGDLERAFNSQSSLPLMDMGIFIITGATAMSGSTYRWKYEIKPAQVDQTAGAGGGSATTPGYNRPYIREFAPTTGYEAYSISEMSNDIWAAGVTKKYGYGVPATDFANTSMLPVQIPIGTAVFAVAQRLDEGRGYYLIINTQAITGNC
jgi:hypothetical protein